MSRRRVLTIGAAIGALVCLASDALAAPPVRDAGPAITSAEFAAFNGVWVLADPPTALRTLEGEKPPLRKGVRAADKAAAAGVERCLPAGAPRIYQRQRGAFRMVIGREKAALTFEDNHLYRLIYLNSEHFEAAGPAYLGQSIGHWEGAVLVVETNNFNAATTLDNAGLPHSEALKLTERFSIEPDGRLRLEMTFDDPKTFTRPWKAQLRFARRDVPLLDEDYCLRRSGLLDAAPKP